MKVIEENIKPLLRALQNEKADDNESFARFIHHQEQHALTRRNSVASDDINQYSHGETQMQRRTIWIRAEDLSSSGDLNPSILNKEIASLNDKSSPLYKRTSLSIGQEPFGDWIQVEDPYAILFRRWKSRYTVVDESGIALYTAQAVFGRDATVRCNRIWCCEEDGNL
jgi:hypothetical protein